jgi:amidase
MERRYLPTLLLVVFASLALTTAARADDDFQVVEATIAQLQAQYHEGNLSPEDVVEMYLARIARFDTDGPQPIHGGIGPQPLNSFMHVNEHASEDEGRLQDFEVNGSDGEGEGRPLFGIPIILKDNIATKDMPTTAGSVALGASRPEKDATIAKKLRQAGAILIGKATLTEYANFIAIGMPTGYSSQLRFQLFEAGGNLAKVGFGFNPFDPRVDPRAIVDPGPPPVSNDGRPVLATGGSSSGPGIAVSANLATVGVGTETSGSILSPSGQNMLVGIKPTLGLVSRHGIVPITADQDTAGPMARTVTDAAKLLGVLAGFDEKDPATGACHAPGNCFSDYTQFLDRNALRGARIAVPKHPYWFEFGLGAARTALMNDAIAVMRSLGATVEDCEIPSQNVLNHYGTCVIAAHVNARRMTPPGAIPPCSTVLLFGFKRDLNSYLADPDFGPGTSASSPTIPQQTIHTLSDVIAFDALHPEVALKYGQQIAEAAQMLNTGPGPDLNNYQADRALDLKLTQRCGLDVLFTGVIPAECNGLPNFPAQGSCVGRRHDAVLFPANFGANAPARAGYPSVIVPAGMFPNIPFGDPLPQDFGAKPSPFGATFSGPAFSERKLIGYAYAFEQATQVRHHLAPLGPPSAPPLPPDGDGAVSLPPESESASGTSSEATSETDSSAGICTGVCEALDDVER